jgi:hypothetical protein
MLAKSVCSVSVSSPLLSSIVVVVVKIGLPLSLLTNVSLDFDIVSLNDIAISILVHHSLQIEYPANIPIETQICQVTERLIHLDSFGMAVKKRLSARICAVVGFAVLLRRGACLAVTCVFFLSSTFFCAPDIACAALDLIGLVYVSGTAIATRTLVLVPALIRKLVAFRPVPSLQGMSD